jgi:4-amino-4-deoxy-L-arabinose transferase-like glycosyltransferase
MVWIKRSQSKNLDNCFLTTAGLFILAILLAMISELFIPQALRQEQSTDFVNYYLPVGENIADGYGLSAHDGSAAVLYPPGYPLMIAGVVWIGKQSGVPADVLLNYFTLVCFGLTVVLVYRIARTIWSRYLALVPALLWLSYPFALWLVQQPNVEMPFLVVILLSFGLWWKGNHSTHKRGFYFFIGGILLGAAMLVRPIALFVGIILGVLLFIRFPGEKIWIRIGFVLVFLAGALLPVLPWEIWAYRQTDKVILLSTKDVHSVLDGLTFAVNSQGYRQDFHINGSVESVMGDIYIQAERLESFPTIFNTLVAEARSRPVGLLQLFLIKAGRSWYGTNSGRGEVLIQLVQIPYILLICVAFVLNCRKKANRFLAVTIGSLILYFWAMTILVLSILRYMVPVFAFAFLFTPEVLPGLKGLHPGLKPAAATPYQSRL